MAQGNDLPITESEIRGALAEILRQTPFCDSPQLQDFLTYIVNKTLDGKQDELKAYTIAVDALGRSEDFDPQTNAAVRVAAGRLRQALANFYADETELSCPIRFVLEPGSYVPSFQRFVAVETTSGDQHGTKSQVDGAEPAEVSSTPSAGHAMHAAKHYSWLPSSSKISVSLCAVLIAATVTWLFSVFHQGSSQNVGQHPGSAGTPILKEIDANRRPVVQATVLLPDHPYPVWFKANEFVDTLAVVVAKFDDFQFSDVRAADTPALDDRRISDNHLFITAYGRNDNINLLAKLLRERDGAVIWSTQRTVMPPPRITDKSMIDLVGQAYSPLASPYGVIHQDLLNPGGTRDKLDCVVAAYQYFSSESVQAHAKARDCAEKRVAEGTRLPGVFAILTFLYLDEFRAGRNPRSRDPLQAAEAMAMKAVEAGPQSARAHQALFAVYKVQGKREQARKAAKTALSLNSYDSDIVADMGAWLISIGEIDEGRKLLRNVADMLPAQPAWLQFYRYLGAELAGDFQAADDLAVMLDATRSPLLAVAVALGAGRLGDNKAAGAAIDQLIASAPGFRRDPEHEFLTRGFDPAIARRIVDMLKKAGLQVDPASMN